jgi:hypothetical protein
MYTLLKDYDNTEDAIRNTKRVREIYKGRQNYAEHNLCTMV